MRIGVLVKASLDLNMLRADPSGKLLIDAIPLIISEYDRNAITEAVRIREKKGGKIFALSVLTWPTVERRGKELENVMREALAIGADEAHVVIDKGVVLADPSVTAFVLARLIESLGGMDIILAGEASQDMGSSQLPIRLASYLGYNVVTFVREVEVLDGYLRVTRDLEDYYEVLKVPCPAVVSVTGEINQPKLPTLLEIRRAFAKPYKVYSLSTLQIPSVEKLIVPETVDVLTISRKNVIFKEGKLEEIADKLIDKLIEEGVIRV